MNEKEFHGVDLDWMKAQWRDCRDKAVQLGIFQDMVGKSVPVQEILDAVGEPEYCGPLAPAKRGYRRFTPEEDAQIARMASDGATDRQIGDALGRDPFSISARIKNLRRRGDWIVRGKKKPKDEPEIVTELPSEPEAAPDTATDPADMYPDGGALPLEIGDLPGSEALEAVGGTLQALLDEEEALCDRIRVVRDMIGEYRKKLRELLAMAEGGLTDGKDQI